RTTGSMRRDHRTRVTRSGTKQGPVLSHRLRPTTFVAVGWRPIVSAIGRVFMAVGTLMLLFVAYELWGTGISEARSQTTLKHDFAKIQQQAPKDETRTEYAPPAPTGTAIAIIKIPRIGVEK